MAMTQLLPTTTMMTHRSAVVAHTSNTHHRLVVIAGGRGGAGGFQRRGAATTATPHPLSCHHGPKKSSPRQTGKSSSSLSLFRQHRHSSRHHPGVLRRAAAFDGDGGGGDPSLFDAYEVLGVGDDADVGEIKRAYLALQKRQGRWFNHSNSLNFYSRSSRFHPDVLYKSGDDAGDDAREDDDETRSTEINRAYVTLTTPSARVALDDALMRANGGVRRRRNGSGETVLSATGLVGPLREKFLLSRVVCGGDADGGGGVDACDVDTVFEMTESIREWGKILAFTSEMPLPLPLQCDDIDRGLRLAMITFTNGRIKEVGALNITVDVVFSGSEITADADADADADDTRVEVRVSRSWAGDGQKGREQLPGESRILANFAEEFAFLVDDGGLKGGQTTDEDNDFVAGLKGFASNITSFALPVLPFFGSTREVMPGGSYNGYRIKRKNDGGSGDISDEA